MIDNEKISSTEKKCRLCLPSSIGSICGKPSGHEGRCGEPIASTPPHPARHEPANCGAFHP